MAKQCRVCLIQEPYATFVSMHAGKKENAINYLIVTGIMVNFDIFFLNFIISILVLFSFNQMPLHMFAHIVQLLWRQPHS